MFYYNYNNTYINIYMNEYIYINDPKDKVARNVPLFC